MSDEKMPRVTGKQVLNDALTLAKDTGTFIFDLGRLAVYKIKCALEKEKSSKQSEPPVVTVTAK